MKSGKKKNSRRTARNVCQLGIGVLAGGLMFVGQAKAGVVFSESFENSPNSAFGTIATYAYSQNYTSAVIPPGAGDVYFTGTPGLASNTLTVNASLTGANGLTAAQLDTGTAKFNLSAYFSTYYTQNDWSSVSVQFKDGSSVAIGSPRTVGGAAFVAALGANTDGARDWGLDAATGDIPVGARSADVSLLTTRLAGSAADGYADVIKLEVTDSGQIPEPGALAWLAAAGLALRRKPARRGKIR